MRIDAANTGYATSKKHSMETQRRGAPTSPSTSRRSLCSQMAVCISLREVGTYLGQYAGMVPRGRVELPTPAFSGPRSTGELPRHRYNQRFYGKPAGAQSENGAPREILFCNSSHSVPGASGVLLGSANCFHHFIRDSRGARGGDICRRRVICRLVLHLPQCRRLAHTSPLRRFHSAGTRRRTFRSIREQRPGIPRRTHCSQLD
jgi:hypothetical protein